MRLTSLHEIQDGVAYQTKKRTYRPSLEQIEVVLEEAAKDKIIETKVISGSTILLITFLDSVMMYGAPPNGTAATVQDLSACSAQAGEAPSQVEAAA